MADFSLDDFTKEVLARMEAAHEKSQEISRISKTIADGAGTYADVERLASLTGKSTGKVLADALVEKAVDGKVTEEVAKAILSKPLEGNYEAIAEACQQAQEALNRKAGLGLKAVKPEFPRSRINGLVTEVTGKDDMNNFAGTLVQQVENLSLSTVDDSVRVNAAAHSRAGLYPKIKRISDGKCCKWCSALAGTYDYYDVNDTGNDVFRRHNNCRCQILYDPGDGARMQDVHSKRLLSAEESAKIEARKTAGIYEEKKDPEQREADAEILKKGGLGSGSGNGIIKPHDPPVYLKTISINDEEQIATEIEAFEKLAIDSPIETALVILQNGDVYKCYGVIDGVYPDADFGDKLKGAIVSHNHPASTTEYSFSDSDRLLFYDYKLRLLRGKDHMFTYQIDYDTSNIDIVPENALDYVNIRHSMMIRDAHKFNFGYRRWEND